MIKIISTFFMILGVIFFLILIAGGYYFSDIFITSQKNTTPTPETTTFRENSQTEPYSSKSPQTESPSKNTTDPSLGTSPASHPLLSDNQIKTLETFGIDTSQIPEEITPEQEACFISAIGKDRVEAIKAGDSPSALEFFKAKSCI